MNFENIWTWSDIVQLFTAFLLFIVGIWIGKTQEKSVTLTKDLTKEIKSLQTALAELQMYEKIGVIGRGLNRLSEGEVSAAPSLLYDCLALLPMLEFSGKTLSDKYVKLLRQSLDKLTEYYLLDKEPMSASLISHSLTQVKILERKGSQKLAKEITNALARYLDELKSTDKQKLEEICSHFLHSEQVKYLVIAEKGDTYTIMELLHPSK